MSPWVTPAGSKAAKRLHHGSGAFAQGGAPSTLGGLPGGARGAAAAAEAASSDTRRGHCSWLPGQDTLLVLSHASLHGNSGFSQTGMGLCVLGTAVQPVTAGSRLPAGLGGPKTSPPAQGAVAG